MIPLIGLTGGIGSGKSTALECFQRLGCATLSSDSVVHDLYDSPVVRDAVVERFGAAVAPDGAVARDELAERVFANAQDRVWLEELLWPLVGDQIGSWLRTLADSPDVPRAAVVEVPLLFEAEMQEMFGFTVAVLAGDELRDRRAQARGHVAVSEREGRQLSEDEKAKRADYVLENRGSIAALENDVADLLAEISSR